MDMVLLSKSGQPFCYDTVRSSESLLLFFGLFQNFDDKPIPDILEAIVNASGLYVKCQLYGILLKREGPNYEFNGNTGQKIHFSFSRVLRFGSLQAIDLCRPNLPLPCYIIESLEPYKQI